MGYATERFAKRLKEIREASGLTQTQLASELKVSRGAISYYENGERTPDIEFLDSFVNYFDLPTDFVMGYTDNVKEEYVNMYEFYGLNDAACKKLEWKPELGQLISKVLGHKNFDALEDCYCSILKNYNYFNFEQLGYSGFLISDSLNKIIFDSLVALRDMQFTDEEKEALRIRSEVALKELDTITQEWNEREKRDLDESMKFNKSNYEKQKDSLHCKAHENIRKKFYEGVRPLERKRHFPL